MVPPGRCHRDGTNPSIVSSGTGWRLGAISGCQVVLWKRRDVGLSQKVPRATEPADAGRPQFRSQPPWKRSKSKRHPSKTCTYKHQNYVNMPHGTPWTIQDLTNAYTTRAHTHTHMQTYAQVHTSLHMQTYPRRYTVYAHMYSRKPSNHYAQKSKHTTRDKGAT